MGEIRRAQEAGRKYLEIGGDLPVRYELPDDPQEFPIECLLCDLDGTLIKSEAFWIELIERTVRETLGRPFSLEESDLPFVSGYTTLQHLQYCLDKYAPQCSLIEANERYHRIAERELKEIEEGRGNLSAFCPREGAGDFLREVKRRGVRIGLATSGLRYKCVPEILALCRREKLGDPLKFFDAIITGGDRKGSGEYGTLGELCAKPHPFLYRELAQAGLKQRNLRRAIGLEDSAAGVVSLRLAGVQALGFSDGNIRAAGFEDLCLKMISDFDSALLYIDSEKK